MAKGPDRQNQHAAENENPAPISDSEGEGDGVEGENGRTQRLNGDSSVTIPSEERPIAEAVEPVSDDEEDAQPSGAAANNQQHEQIDEVYVGRMISQYMVANKVNWANVDCVEDVWTICDAISASHGGLPDSLLKEAFLLVVQSNLHQHGANVWIRQHLQKLLREWKKEVQSTKSFNRPTKFVAAATDIHPPEEGVEHEIDEGEPPAEESKGNGCEATPSQPGEVICGDQLAPPY